MKIIRLGNPSPKKYRQPPELGADLPIAVLRAYAVAMQIDVSDILPGDESEAAKLHQRATRLVEIPWESGEVDVQFQISPDSSPGIVLMDIRNAWWGSSVESPGHASSAPSWISGNDPMLVELLRAELCVGQPLCEVREFNAEIGGQPPPNRGVL